MWAQLIKMRIPAGNEEKLLEIKIPAGVDNGSRLRIAGEGEAGSWEELLD